MIVYMFEIIENSEYVTKVQWCILKLSKAHAFAQSFINGEVMINIDNESMCGHKIWGHQANYYIKGFNVDCPDEPLVYFDQVWESSNFPPVEKWNDGIYSFHELKKDIQEDIIDTCFELNCWSRKEAIAYFKSNNVKFTKNGNQHE